MLNTLWLGFFLTAALAGPDSAPTSYVVALEEVESNDARAHVIGHKIVNEAAEFSKDSPEPDSSELWTDIYA